MSYQCLFFAWYTIQRSEDTTMILEMKNGEKKDFEHFKDGEGKMIATMFFDGQNRILHGKLEPGASIGFHEHVGNSEIIYILSGNAKYIYDDGVEYAGPGQCHYCPEHHSHSMINEGPDDLEFFAVVPQKEDSK